MIRRWSHIILVENDFCDTHYYLKRFKFRIFRLNVRFRRFNLKKTKFKRKALIRLKHRTNFFPKFDVIKYWTKDFKFAKNYYKYQFLLNILNQNALAYDPNFFKPMSEYHLYNFNGKLNNLSKLFFKHLHTLPIFYAKKMHFSLASYTGNFDKDSNIAPILAVYDTSLFDVDVADNVNFFADQSIAALTNFWFNFFFINLFKIQKITSILVFVCLNATTLKNLFLKLINFRKKVHRANTSRNLNFFSVKLNFQPKFSPLSYLKKNSSGRGAQGKIIIRTRTSVLHKRRQVRINFTLNYKKLSVVGGFVFVPYKNKLLSLFFFSNGAAAYFLTTQNHKMFHCSTFLFQKKFRKLNVKRLFAAMFKIKKLSFLSCLSLTPATKAQYVRSPGCASRLFKFDKEKHAVTMELPSGSKKLFSYYSLAFLSPIANFNNKNFTNGKAGYWRSFGEKSIVRGVAKNPVDHPHGGRTKAIRYQRTPWGKTTKYK